MLQPNVIDQRELEAVIELGQQVDVAFRTGVAASDRAEQAQPLDPERTQLGLLGVQQRQHPVAVGEAGPVEGLRYASHGCIVPRDHPGRRARPAQAGSWRQSVA
jgi:hypothetical protein